MSRYIAFLGLALGCLIGAGVALGPRSVERFKITPKTACLTPEGFTFKIDYVGRGTAFFTVVAPETPQQKESK